MEIPHKLALERIFAAAGDKTVIKLGKFYFEFDPSRRQPDPTTDRFFCPSWLGSTCSE